MVFLRHGQCVYAWSCTPGAVIIARSVVGGCRNVGGTRLLLFPGSCLYERSGAQTQPGCCGDASRSSSAVEQCATHCLLCTSADAFCRSTGSAPAAVGRKDASLNSEMLRRGDSDVILSTVVKVAMSEVYLLHYVNLRMFVCGIIRHSKDTFISSFMCVCRIIIKGYPLTYLFEGYM